MEDGIVLLIILAVVGLIVLYLISAKKSGKKCIGCPYANDCKNKRSCSCKNNEQDQIDE